MRNVGAHTVDEGVQDGHGTVGDTGVGVNLLEDLVDVGRVGLLSGLGALLLSSLGTSSLLASLLQKSQHAKRERNRNRNRSGRDSKTGMGDEPSSPGGPFRQGPCRRWWASSQRP